MRNFVICLCCIFLLCLVVQSGNALASESVAKPSLPYGFIALAPKAMTWGDAKAYCEHQGGRLPLINGSTSWGSCVSLLSFRSSSGFYSSGSVDGFGAIGRPWPSGLPSDTYWSGTVCPDIRGNSWVIDVNNNNVNVIIDAPYYEEHRVICVP